METSTENTCVYCQQGAVDIALQLRWCIHGIHEAPRHTFTRPGTGTEGVEMCNPCFFSALDQVGHNEDEDLPEPPSSQAASEVSSYNYSRRSSAASAASELGSMNLSAPPRPQAFSRASSPAPRQLDDTEPIIEYEIEKNDLMALALSEKD